MTSLLDPVLDLPLDPVPAPVSVTGSAPAALTVAVTGGCGGAGASVLAAVLARTAAPMALTLLIDGDRLGSGADLLLGAENEPGLRWPQLSLARGPLVPGSLTGLLPLVDGLRVLAWDREPSPAPVSAETVAAVVAAARQEAELVVLDLPRVLDPPVRAAAVTADLTLLVVPATVRGVTSARRSAEELAGCGSEVLVVVRDGDLPPEQVAAALGCRLAGVLRSEPGLDDALRRGEPPGLRRRGPLARFCHDFLTARPA